MHFPKLQRRPELDAIRGLFLVWMTLAHLPTRFSEFVNQPIGFVSSAEGFVFLSALLVARLYIRQAHEDHVALRTKLWRRALKIYGYHLLMLALVFTVAATLAVTTHRVALYNLLNFYLAHPFVAIIGSLLLLYCPPLLDILPMYVIFLAFTPTMLSAAIRWGWKRVLAASGLIWLLAQFGLRDLVHNAVVHLTGLPIPVQESGAFNLFAWQWVWIAGLWLGARSAEGQMPLRLVPGWASAAGAAVCLFFIGVRHNWLGPHLTADTFGLQLDKWSIGPLRILNLIAFTIVVFWLRRFVLKLVAVEPFLTLGKASLEVFCAHLFFVFIGLALLAGDVPQLHGLSAISLLVVTFSGLILVAAREVRRRHQHGPSNPTQPPQSDSPVESVPSTSQHNQAPEVVPAQVNSRALP